MKKILILVSIGLAMFSCKKQNFSPDNNENTANLVYLNKSDEHLSNYYANEKYLIFDSLKDFETVVDQPSEDTLSRFINDVSNLNFPSYYRYLVDEKPEEDLVDDELLSHILNRDLIVQIGNYLYRVNKNQSKVFVLAKEDNEYYYDLATENTLNKSVLEFSIDDDIFYLLGETQETKGNNCSQSTQNISERTYTDVYPDEKWTDELGIYGTPGKKYKFKYKAKVRYDNWGIYKKLFTEFKHWETWGGTWDATHFSVYFKCSYQSKNGMTGYQEQTLLYNYWDFLDYNGTGGWLGPFYQYQDKKKEFVHYRSTKCLKTFNLDAFFWYRDRTVLKPRWAPVNNLLLHINQV